MEKIKEVEVTQTKKIHEFYCDICGKKIGEKEEIYTDDGNLLCFSKKGTGQYARTFFLDNSHLTYCKNLCDECMQSEEQKIVDTLKELGFTSG